MSKNKIVMSMQPPMVLGQSSAAVLLNTTHQTRYRLGGCSNAKLYDLIGAGKLTIVKLGRRSYVTEAEIQRFVATLEPISPADRARRAPPRRRRTAGADSRAV
jgi:hypothetical protein